MKLKRIMAMILCVAMVLSTMSFNVFAESETVTDAATLKTAMESGGTVVLGSDITVEEMIEIPAATTVTLNLNGNSIISGYQEGFDETTDSPKHIYPFDIYGNLTIKDETGDGSVSGRGIFLQNGAKLTVESGSIYGIDSNGGSAIYMYGGKLDINGGHIEQDAEGTYNFAVNALAGSVTVDDGWIGGNHGAIACENAEVVLNNGTYVCTGTPGMTDNVLYSYGSGSITINNGTFIADNDGPAGGCCVYDSNGSVVVNNGSFSNSSGGDVWGTTGTTIKGGTFESLTETDHVVVGATIVNGGKTYTKTDSGEMVEIVPPVATINGVEYVTFEEALEATKALTGDVTVEILDKVTLKTSISGNFDSIKFVGNNNNAEIYLDVQGYITASGKNVEFEDLTLSKSEGGFISNAGFMNVAFGVYDVNKVTYTNCTFANGSYASSGKVLYTDCTFYRSHDKYGLWAYGNVDCTVDGCKFADYRGIKMYAEGKENATELTVKSTDFSQVNNKPAIVLTYGESVTLEDNKYSGTGVFELDLDGAPNGTTVTSDVAPTCKNDNGACGVLVDGKIYTTVADAADVAVSGSTVTLLHDSDETVEFAKGVTLDKNGYTADGVTVETPVAKIGNVEYKTIEAAIQAAQVGDTVTILEGTYAVPSAMKAGITIEGEGTVILEGTLSGTLENLTLKNLHIKGGNAQRWAYAKGDLVFEDVTFEATSVYALHFDGITAGANLLYKDCTIIGWAAMSGSPASCVFNGCTFKDNGKYGLIRTYFDSEIKDCKFDVDGADHTDVYQDGIHAVGSTVKIYNCTNENGKLADIINATSSNTGDRAYVYVDDNLAIVSSVVVKVSTKDELNRAINNASDGDTITLTADIDYGTDQLKIEKPITLDLGGMTLTTRNAWGGMSVKNNPTIKNGTIVHASNTAAIKVWNATAFEDLVIDVQGKGDAGKTIGGIVLQSGTTTRVDSIKNVTIKGVALTNGIETYNCGDATEDVIGSMENVNIDALGTGMLISAPCGTATNCNIKGSINGIEIWIKGTYSAKLGLVDCDVEGGIYAHDEFNSNPDIQNNGTLSLTADANTTGAKESDVTLNIARAEKVEGVLEDVMNNSKAKLGDTYYPTFGAAIEAAQNGDTVTLLADVKLTGKFTITKEITIVGNGYSISADETAVWYTTSGKLNIKKYNKHLIGINADNVTLKNIVLDNNNNAAGINLYCAQNVLFDNVSIINATKGMAALTVNGSTLTIKTNFDALGNAIAMDISNGSGVTSNLGVTVEDGTVFDLDNKTVKFGEAAAINMSNAVYADGNPYFAAMDNAYLYTENQINSRTTAFSNGLILLSDVELTKVISVKGSLDINGKTLTISENNRVKVESNLSIIMNSGTINGGFNITKADVTITAEKGLDVSTNVADSAVIYVNGVYRVVPAIAKIGEKLYGTLADAFDAANDDDEIDLISDVVINEDTRTHNTGSWYDGVYYIGDKSFTIDLNGFTITHDGSVNDYLLNFKNDGTKANEITIKNGVIDAGTDAFCAICTSSTSTQQITINLEDVTLINNVSNGSTAKIRGGAVLNVKKGTVIKGLNSYLGIECVASTVNIYDGAEIYQNGTSSYLGGLVGACGNGVVNVYGGYGKSAKCGFVAMTSGGTINVHGGEWISNTDGSIGDNSNLHVLTSQNNSKESGYTGASVINVTGGTFHGGMDAWILNTGLNEVAELNITGGIFNTNPQTYVEAGYESKKAGNLWKVVKSATSATVKAHSETSTVKAGDKVTVQVIAEGFDFTNGDWELRYDPTMFELDAAATTYYKDTTKGVEAQSVNSADENTLAGKVIAVGGSLKQGNEIPSGTVLATYTFTALPQSKDTVSGKFDIVNAHINTYDYAISQTNVPANCVDFDITITRENRSITGSLELTTVTYNGDIQKGNAFVVAPSVVGRDNAVITYSTEENGIYTTELPTFKEAGSYKIWVKVNVDGYAEYNAEHEYMVIGAKDIALSLEVAAGAAYQKVNVKPVITGVYDAEFEGTLTISGVDYTYKKDDFIYMGNNMAIAKEAKPMSVVAGSNEVTITYTQAPTDNYANASATTTVDADKAFATQTIVDDLNAAADAAETYTYNGTEHKAQDKINAPEGWSVTVTRISDGTANPGVTNVADKEFVEIRFTHANYNDVVVSRVLKVEPLDLTIIVPDFEKGAGEPDNFTTKSVTYTSGNFVRSAEFATLDELVATGNLNVSIVRKTFGEDAGKYDLTATYTPNDNYDIVIDDGALTIGMPSDTVIEVVNNKLNGNGNSSADYVAGYKLVLVYTNTATARYTYDDKQMFDLSNAGYEYFDNTKSIADQTEDNYKYVYGIIVKAETGKEDAYYADKVDFIGTNKYVPEKIVYDADINYDDKFTNNDTSSANSVLNVEYGLDSFFMYYFLKADYDRTAEGEFKSDKMVKLFDVQEVQKFINTKTTIK